MEDHVRFRLYDQLYKFHDHQLVKHEHDGLLNNPESTRVLAARSRRCFHRQRARLAVWPVVGETAPWQMNGRLKARVVFLVGKVGWREHAAVRGNRLGLGRGDRCVGDELARQRPGEVFPRVILRPPVHRRRERPSPMGGVQSDERHFAGKHTIRDPLDVRFGHFALPDMAPPDDHLRPVQVVIGKALLRIVERDRAQLEIAARGLEPLGDFIAQPVVVRLGLARLAFIPDQYTCRLRQGRGDNDEEKREREQCFHEDGV